MRSVHRLSPLLRVWAFALVMVTLAVFNFTAPLYEWLQREDLGWVAVAWALGGVVVALLAVLAISQLWWANTWFRITPEEIEYKRGVLTSQVRATRYDRIQAVDIVEPLAARIFGLAGVRVEAAGGVNAAIEIAYLRRDDAEAIRAEILQRIAAKTDTTPAEAAEAVEYLVEPIPIGRSLAASALQWSTAATVLAATAPLWSGLTLAAVVPILVGFIPQIWRTVDQSWRFNATHDAYEAHDAQRTDVFNLTYGLANRRRQAVPRDRIHAVQLKQPMLWRPFGWWTVSVTTAGYGSERNKATGTSKLLPVGTFAQAAAVIDAVGPLTAAELTSAEPASPHASVRSPKRARWVSPVDWRTQTVTLTGTTAATTARVTFGRLTRRYQMVEVPHIQELTFKQGPLQRRLNLANVRLDLVPGAIRVTARDVAADEGRALVDKLRARTLPQLTVE